MQNDKYLNDPTAWFQNAQNFRSAAVALFRNGNPFMYFPAAILGHQALEMYLKAALIRQGLRIGRSAGDAWGHDLVDLAKKLVSKGNIKFPNDLFEVLQIFNDYFDELRYPRQLANVTALGEEEGERLEDAIKYLLPYAGMPKAEGIAIMQQG